MPNHFKTIFVSNCLFILLCGYVISKANKPNIIELREKWRYETEDSAMKDINNCCSQMFCFKPESRLCGLDKQSHRDFVGYIRSNECYDLYQPDDIHFFESDFKPSNTCDVLQHFQTPLTRCLYSNKFLCDSITGYFKRENERRFLLFASFVLVTNSNLDSIYSFVSRMSSYVSSEKSVIYSFVSSEISRMPSYASSGKSVIYSFGSRVSNAVRNIPFFKVDRICSLFYRYISV
jgi:hypothetical protein